MVVFLTGSTEMRDAIMRSGQVWEHLRGFGIRRSDVAQQVSFGAIKEQIEAGDVIIGPMVYSFAAKAAKAVYVKQSSPRGVWREGKDRADDLFVEGQYRVRARELVTADSVKAEDRLIVTRHDHLRQVYVDKDLMRPTETIIKGNVEKSMVEGKHILGVCPPNVSHWAKSFTEVQMPMPVHLLKTYEYNVPLEIARKYILGVGSYEVTLLDCISARA